jgi:hypothetical protein
MNEKELLDIIWFKYPYTYRNNRGRCMRTDENGNRSPVRFGIPEPRGRKESDYDPKGGDRIGWHTKKITKDMVGKNIAVFTNIEAKTKNDVIKPGQIKFHNQVILSGGISEIWIEQEDGSIKKIKEYIDAEKN